jgi:demethylspheroidene O-methyltransferase
MGRISTIGGSFFDPPALPADIDAVSLVRVLLDHDDHDATRILKTARSALPAGGTLLIAEAISDHPQSRRVADTYFNFYLMAMGRGRPRSLSQFKTLGARAGFTDFKVIPTPRPMITSLIRARAA